MLEVAGGNRDEVGDTQRWYKTYGTVDTSTREIEVPSDTWRREELCQTLTHIVSGEGGKLSCVKSWALVKNSGQWAAALKGILQQQLACPEGDFSCSHRRLTA